MKELFSKLSSGAALSETETTSLFEAMLEDKDSPLSDAQIGAYLFATATRRPVVAELVGAVRSLRKHALRPTLTSHLKELKLLDTCGTGGSGIDSFNTSTASAILSAACGVYVAKHGNRAATSSCGSADLLSALGVKIDCPTEIISRCLEETFFCFLFAPHYHPATKRVVPIRKSLGFRTIFNFLGPLSNPLEPKYQVLGVSSSQMLPVIAESLKELGTQRALVVRGEDGLDEISLSTATLVFEINNGNINSYKITPEQFGFTRNPLSSVAGTDATKAAIITRGIFNGELNPYSDLVAMNTGAALYVSQKAQTISEGIEIARNALTSRTALPLLDKIIKVTNQQETDR